MGKVLVSDLPPHLRRVLAGRDVLVFDGVCVLCSGMLRFVMRHDRVGRFHFATAQGPVGQALYAALDLPSQDFETNLAIIDGRIHQRMDAVAAIMGALGPPWPALAALRWLPVGVKDVLYHAIARRRYRLFGRHAQCMIPDPALRSRFLDAVPGPLSPEAGPV